MKRNNPPARLAKKRPLKQAGLNAFCLRSGISALCPAQGCQGAKHHSLSTALVRFNSPAGCRRAGRPSI